MAVCIPYYEPQGRLTGYCSAAVVGKTFVDISGAIQSGPLLNTSANGGNITVATAAAASHALGVAAFDAPINTQVTIYVQGMTVPVTAGANIASGVDVEVGATGFAVTLASGKPVGKCLTAALSGADAMIRLY